MSIPAKPKFGSPCNGCGLCCAMELCEVAEIAFKGASAPCPALKLVPDGSRTYCELVAVEAMSDLPKMIAEALGIGAGCSMEDAR